MEKRELIRKLSQKQNILHDTFLREKIIEDFVNENWNKDKEELIELALHYRSLFWSSDETARKYMLENTELLRLIEWAWCKLMRCDENLANELERRLNELGYSVFPLCENCKRPYLVCTCGE